MDSSDTHTDTVAEDAQFREIFRTLSEGVALNEMVFNDNGIMTDYRLLMVNDAFYKITDLPKGTGSVIGGLASKIYGMESSAIQNFWETHKDNTDMATSEFNSTANGKCYSVTTSPFFNGRFVTTFLDITDRKKIELRLHEVLDNSIDAVYKMDLRTGIYDFFSPAFFRISGYTPAEMQKTPEDLIEELVHPDDAVKINNVLEKSLTCIPGGKFEIEYRFRHKDGHFVWLHDKYIVQRDPTGKAVALIGSVSDITEKKIIEDRLTESEERYHSLFNTSLDAMLYTAPGGDILAVNASACRMFGRTEEEIKRNGRNGIMDLTDPRLGAALEERKRTGFFSGELTFVRKGGATFSGEITSSVFQNKNGESRTSMVIRDTSERKAVAEKIQSLLAEKELILKEIHHRIKNNMNTIYSLLSLQAASMRDTAAITALEDAGKRVQSMMILYTKLYQAADYNELSLALYLPQLIDEIASKFPNSATVTLIKKIDDFVLDATKLQPLGIIINELITNIMKYAFLNKPGGTITVSASLLEKRVTLVVEDDGSGMPDSVSFANSTGFGLVLINGLTEQLGGTIRIERGQGTRIVLEFDR